MTIFILREKLGISQRDLAEIIGVFKTTLLRFEQFKGKLPAKASNLLGQFQQCLHEIPDPVAPAAISFQVPVSEIELVKEKTYEEFKFMRLHTQFLRVQKMIQQCRALIYVLTKLNWIPDIDRKPVIEYHLLKATQKGSRYEKLFKYIQMRLMKMNNQLQYQAI